MMLSEAELRSTKNHQFFNIKHVILLSDVKLHDAGRRVRRNPAGAECILLDRRLCLLKHTLTHVCCIIYRFLFPWRQSVLCLTRPKTEGNNGRRRWQREVKTSTSISGWINPWRVFTQALSRCYVAVCMCVSHIASSLYDVYWSQLCQPLTVFI